MIKESTALLKSVQMTSLRNKIHEQSEIAFQDPANEALNKLHRFKMAVGKNKMWRSRKKRIRLKS